MVSRMSPVERRLSGVVGTFEAVSRVGGELMDFDRCVWVVANVISERGWFDGDEPGEYLIPGNNLGGWKINEGHVRDWRSAGRKPEDIPKWFRDVGHVGSGDQPEVYYRIFSSVEEFFEEWLRRFVPVPGSVGVGHRYYKTGMEFWRQDNRDSSVKKRNNDNKPNGWFRELCLAGYKGPVTQAKPDKSVESFWRIAARVKAMIVQDRMNRQGSVRNLPRLTPDGVWGDKSRDVAEKFLRGIGACKELSDTELNASLANGPSKGLVEALINSNKTG